VLVLRADVFGAGFVSRRFDKELSDHPGWRVSLSAG
jgi:hypothetical protein